MRSLLFSYFQSIRFTFLLLLLLFLFAMLTGYLAGKDDPSFAQELLFEFEAEFGDTFELPEWQQFLFIAANNILKTLLATAGGIIFGIFPVFFVWANGSLIGVLFAIPQGVDLITLFLVAIMPHGVFEIPAFLMGAASGVQLGKTVVLKIFRKPASFKKELHHALLFFLIVLVPLFLLASFIEIFITPAIIEFFFDITL